MSPAPRCLVACRDLMGWSRLANLVRAAGCEPVQVKDPEDLAARLATDEVHAVLVDLADRAGGLEAVAAAVAAVGDRDLPVVAFGPHKDTALLEGARAAGADPVLPNSALVSRLPGLLQDKN